MSVAEIVDAYPAPLPKTLGKEHCANWPTKRNRQRREDSPRRKHAAQVARGPHGRIHEVTHVLIASIARNRQGAIYEFAIMNYDLCFTRDAEFSRCVQSRPVARLKLVHVVIPQAPQDEFVQRFVKAFCATNCQL